MPKNILVILTRHQKHFEERIKSLNLPDLEIIAPEDVNNAGDDVAKATIFFAHPPLAVKYINSAKNVRWVQSTFAGNDMMNDPVLRKDYILTNVRGVYGEAMAEYVFSYMLFFEKEISENLSHQREKDWSQRKVNTIKGRTICILGTGSIGAKIAELAKAFGMRTLGFRTKTEPVEHFDEVFTQSGLGECLPQADYVVSVLPKTKDTDDIVNKETLSQMKATSIFFNIGRGNAVNEEDLIWALNEKKISKAVLDVFKEEPLPKDSPLWSVENLYITPHMSGYTLNEKMLEIFAENYRRFVKGEEMLYKVDFKKGY